MFLKLIISWCERDINRSAVCVWFIVPIQLLNTSSVLWRQYVANVTYNFAACERVCVLKVKNEILFFWNLDLTQVQHDCNIKQREFLSNHYARLNIFKLDSELSASSFVCSSLKRTWNISCKYVCNIIPFCSFWYRQWHWFKVINNPRPQNFHLRNWAIFLKSYKSSVWPVGSRIYQHLAIYNNENSHNRINF